MAKKITLTLTLNSYSVGNNSNCSSSGLASPGGAGKVVNGKQDVKYVGGLKSMSSNEKLDPKVCVSDFRSASYFLWSRYR